MTSSVKLILYVAGRSIAGLPAAPRHLPSRTLLRVGRATLLAVIVSMTIGIPVARADIDIVVAADDSLTRMDASQTANVFLSRTGTLPNGEAATPVDLNESSDVRDRFYRSIVGRTATQMKTYWSRLIFTGQGEPPRTMNSPEAVKRLIVNTPGAIGYLDSADVDKRVKVLMHLP